MYMIQLHPKAMMYTYMYMILLHFERFMCGNND